MQDNNDIKRKKSDIVLNLLIRAMKGEPLVTHQLAGEFAVSERSVARYISDLKAFLADNRELLGNAELNYLPAEHCYIMKAEHFLSNTELLALTKILIGSRAFSKDTLKELVGKLKANTTYTDRKTLDNLIRKEIHYYNGVNADCEDLLENIWKITEAIENHTPITINYYKMNREWVKHKLIPSSIMFTEYYFYLLAYKSDDENPTHPVYFRIDRITDIVVHREKFKIEKEPAINEGEIRLKSQFMWPGPARKITFEFTGPSVQAILDRLPTAKIIKKTKNASIIEAEVYGDGIKMFLLSQGAWVKVLSPASFVEEMKEEIAKMQNRYE